jgi:hypothetical protein
MLLRTLILICALATPRHDCSIDTAVDVIQGPEAASLVECGLHGQADIAAGAMAGFLDEEHYLKIICTAGPFPGPVTTQEPMRSAMRSAAGAKASP